jgi:hypothetical protein
MPRMPDATNGRGPKDPGKRQTLKPHTRDVATTTSASVRALSALFFFTLLYVTYTYGVCRRRRRPVTRKTFLPSCDCPPGPSPNGGLPSCVLPLSSLSLLSSCATRRFATPFLFLTRLDVSSSSSFVVVVFVVVVVTKNTCYPRVTVRRARPLTASSTDYFYCICVVLDTRKIIATLV